jgi:hypothetical protein
MGCARSGKDQPDPVGLPPAGGPLEGAETPNASSPSPRSPHHCATTTCGRVEWAGGGVSMRGSGMWRDL